MNKKLIGVRCNKIPFGTKKLALDHLRDQLEKLNVYKCKQCNSWHLGREKKILNPKFIQIDEYTVTLGYKNNKKVVVSSPNKFRNIIGLTVDEVYKKLKFDYKLRLLK